LIFKKAVTTAIFFMIDVKYKHMARLESLEKLLIKKQKSKLAKPIFASVVLDKFDKICEQNLSSEIYSGIKLVSFKNKTIKIKCQNSSLAQEIKLKEQYLIKNLNAQFDKQVIEKLLYC